MHLRLAQRLEHARRGRSRVAHRDREAVRHAWRRALSASPPARAIGIAIVGVGKIARDQHLPAIAVSPDFELVATADPAGGVDAVPSYPSLEALLAAGLDLDAVALCCPPSQRAALALSAVDAGLAVLLEKPPAATMAQADEMARRAEARGVALFAAWHSRYAAMVAPARDALAGETIARGSIVWREDAERWHPGQDWLWRAGGFGALDPGINAFSILTAIVGQTVTVARAAFTASRSPDAPVAADITLACGDAAIAVDLDMRETGAQVWTIELETRSGKRLTLRDGGAALEIDGRQASPPDGAGDEYPAIYAAFAETVRARRVAFDAAPLKLALDAIRLAGA